MSQFIFIDESGNSDSDGDPQPFYVVGFLKVDTPHVLINDLSDRHNRHYSGMKQRRRTLLNELGESARPITREEINLLMLSTSHSEYHHVRVGPSNIDKYKSYVDTLFTHPFHFCALVVDRREPKFKDFSMKGYLNSYIELIKFLCKNNSNEGDKFTVIADFLNSPRDEVDNFTKGLEEIDVVHNFLQCHSHGVPLLQVCDLLTGMVNFDHRLAMGITKDSKRAQAKKEFSAHIASKFGVLHEAPFSKEVTHRTEKQHIQILPFEFS
jgi:hypothetical protein